MQLLHFKNPLDDCSCLVRTKPVPLHGPKRTREGGLRSIVLCDREGDVASSCEVAALSRPELSIHVAGFVSRVRGTAPFSRIAFFAAGVKIKSMKLSADFVTVVSR